MQQKGFTLIEITVAVAILAVRWTTLVALQSRYSFALAQDENRTFASLFATSLMADIETSGNYPTESTTNAPLISKLEEIGYFEELPNEPILRDKIKNWSYTLTVTDITPTGIGKVLTRVDINITWGDTPLEQYNLSFVLAGAEDAETS